MITISIGTSCADGKRQSQSLCGAKYLRTCLQPEEQLDEIAFSFRERRRHDKDAFEFIQIPRRRFHLRDMRKGGLDRVLLRLASRVGGSGAGGTLRAFLLESRAGPGYFPIRTLRPITPSLRRGKRNKDVGQGLSEDCVIINS
jgi:hypothetical protein